MRPAILLVLALPPVWVAWLAYSPGDGDGDATAHAAAATHANAGLAPSALPALPIEATGRVYRDDGHLAHVRSPVSGRIVRVDVKAGDLVKAGAPLAVIEPSKYRGTAEESGPYDAPAWASYCADETGLRGAEHRLGAAAAGPDELAAARRSLDRAEQAYERCMPVPLSRPRYVVTAPADGTVIQTTATLDAWVEPGAGAPDLFQVGDRPRWMAEAEVGADNAGRVLAGAPVRARVAAYPGATLAGEVVHVSAVDPSTHVATVTCAMGDLGVLSTAYASVEIGGRG